MSYIKIQSPQAYLESYHRLIQLARSAEETPMNHDRAYHDRVRLGSAGDMLEADLTRGFVRVQQDGHADQGGDYRRTTSYALKDDILRVEESMAANMGNFGATTMVDTTVAVNVKEGTLTILDSKVLLK